jgi:excinuclease ABC subunit C
LDLKKRIKTHFKQPTHKDTLFIDKIKKIETLETGSEIEALILESQLIKKHRPKFNYVWKDDKNYFFIAITKTKPPFVFITHRPSPLGPFIDGKALRQTLKIIRKVFPFYTSKTHPKNKCPWCHLNLCPGPNPDLAKYRKDLGNLKSFLKGKKKAVFRNLKKEMQKASSEQNYELANEIKSKVSALEKILANAKVINKVVDLDIY